MRPGRPRQNPVRTRNDSDFFEALGIYQRKLGIGFTDIDHGDMAWLCHFR
jgi:hypothetical protein